MVALRENGTDDSFQLNCTRYMSQKSLKTNY